MYSKILWSGTNNCLFSNGVWTTVSQVLWERHGIKITKEQQTYSDKCIGLSLTYTWHVMASLQNMTNRKDTHSVERIPPLRNAWSTRTYLAQYIFEISCYTSFLALSFNGEASLKKIIGSTSGSSPKLNLFFLITHPMCPPSFVRICPQLFEISCYISFLAPSLNGEESLSQF